MKITQYLADKDPSLVIHEESEFSSDTKGFKAFNDAGLECETGEFLYGLVRLLKPKRVLETGTHQGVGASYIAQALKDNGFIDGAESPLMGKLITIEFLRPHYEATKARIKKLELESYVFQHLSDVNKFYPPGEGMDTFDMVLLDTEPQTRFEELANFFHALRPGGFIFIHDLHRHMHQIDNEEHGFAWPYGRIPAEVTKWVVSGQLRPFHFSTPRGLTGFYKVHPEDHKWGLPIQGEVR